MHNEHDPWGSREWDNPTTPKGATMSTPKKSHLKLVPDLPAEPAPEPAPVVAEKPEPTIDPRAVELLEGMPGIAKLRLLSALQGLALPKGMRITRGASRTLCAQIVTEMTGLPASGRQKARPPAGSLEVMLSWVIADAERKGYEVTLMPQIIPADERGQHA